MVLIVLNENSLLIFSLIKITDKHFENVNISKWILSVLSVS